MKTTLTLSSTLVALALAVSAVPVEAKSRPTIDGAWRVTITPVDCDTGDTFPQFSVVSNLTFATGGTLVESTSNPRFQPGQRSAGLGYWDYTGRRTYRAYFEAFVQFDSVDPVPPAPPYQRGTQSVDQSIEMQDPNHWTSDALVTFHNASGEKVPPSGCATAAAVRLP